MEKSLQPQLVDNGQFKLLLEEPSASYTMANVIARTINAPKARTARRSPTRSIPRKWLSIFRRLERERPDGFISRVQQLVRCP